MNIYGPKVVQRLPNARTVKTYDFVFAGGGCAGLSLAYHLHLGGLSGKRVLIVDPEIKGLNDRTWCFWENRPTPYDTWCAKSWKVLEFTDEKGTVRQHLEDFTYRLLRGEDFYRNVLSALKSNPGFEFLQGVVTTVDETPDGAIVKVNGESIAAKWVFDSRYEWKDHARQLPEGYHYLKQHFLGWRIRTEKASFDPGVATMMDFRTAQPGHTRFFYVLPFSETEALVEFTLFSDSLIEKEIYRNELKDYIAEKLGLSGYEITEEEYGVIPMTDLLPDPHPSAHVFRLGTVAGAAKASTGYAFLNIQQQAAHYSRAILEQGQPTPLPLTGKRFRIYDSLLLHLLTHEGGITAMLFGKLFRRNPMHLILRFLGERTVFLQELRIMTLMPWPPFFRAIGALARKGRFSPFAPPSLLPAHDSTVPETVSAPARSGVAAGR